MSCNYLSYISYLVCLMVSSLTPGR